MNMKKKIVWVVHEGQLSGANLSLLEYLQLLSENDFEIYLVTPRLGEFTNMAAPFVSHSYEIYFYSWCINPFVKIGLVSSLRKIIRNRIAQKQIGKLLKKIKPDYVATNTITIDIGAIAARKKGIKHIWFVHEFGEKDHGFTFKEGMEAARKIILSLSDIVVVNSLAVLNSFPITDKIKLVYYSIPNRCQIINNKILTDCLRLIMLGQIAESKKQDEAVEAIALCRKRGYHVTLSIYGKIVIEEYGGFLKQSIVQNDLQNFVTIYPPIKDICKPLFQSHALLMCSRNEAFGRVTVEALKCGLPVIGAETGGTCEIVKNDFNGYFYETGNSTDLADKIINLYNNYSNFDHKEIAEDISLKYNEVNTWEQLKIIFEK